MKHARISRRRKGQVKAKIGRWFPPGPKSKDWYVRMDRILRAAEQRSLKLDYGPLSFTTVGRLEDGIVEARWYMYLTPVSMPPLKFIPRIVEI